MTRATDLLGHGLYRRSIRDRPATTTLFYGALVTLGVYSFWMSRVKKSLPAGHPDRMGPLSAAWPPGARS